jgi:hypothetical protein
VQWQEISGSPQLCARIPNTTAPEDPSFERFILRLLLTESFLRTAPPETQAPLPTPPRWIIDAIRHRFHHPDLRFGLSSSRPLIDNAQIPPLSELLSRTAADADSSTPQQESQARTLLYWLCSQPASDSGIRKMLGTRWENASSLHTLRSLFPKLGATDSALERGWTLQLASLGTQQERLALDGTQTLRKLDELLELDLITPAGKRVRYPLSLFSEYLRLAGIQSVLLSREIELMILFGRAHPLYREAIRLYAAACHALAEGKSHGASQLLRQAALSAESATVQLQRYRSPAQPPSPEPTTPASPPRALAIRPEPRDAPLPPLTPDITQRDVEETLRAARMGAAKPLPSSPPPAKPETP